MDNRISKALDKLLQATTDIQGHLENSSDLMGPAANVSRIFKDFMSVIDTLKVLKKGGPYINQPTITSEEIVKELNELMKRYSNKDITVVYMKKSKKFILNSRNWDKEIGVNSRNELYYNLPLPLENVKSITTFFMEVNDNG